MLKDDDIPTLFEHNKDKEKPQKRKSSVMREEKNKQRQLYEQAFQHYKLVKKIEFECNTKETQTDMVFEENSATKLNVGIQCNI